MQRLLKECQAIAEEAARAGGRVLCEHRFKPLEIDHKERQEVVTNVDRLSDAAICDLIQRAFPDHTIVSEESGTQGASSSYTWIVDPLDGTESYIRGQNFSSVTIALMHHDQTVLGVVYQPFLDELYAATRDAPTTLNGHVVRATDEDELSQARLILDYSPRDELREYFNALEWDRGIKQMYRYGGSIALNMCQVAKGAADGYVYGRRSNRVKSWDTAAATFIVTRAGGSALDRDGQPLDTLQPQGFVLCCNAGLDLHRLCIEGAFLPPAP